MKMHQNGMRRVVASAAIVGLSAAAQANVVNQYNLVVTGNMANNSIDVRGPMFVGGNLTGGAIGLARDLSPTLFQGLDTVVVAGNISVANLDIRAGNLRRGGTRSGALLFNQPWQVEIVDPTLPGQVAGVAGQLTGLSNFYRTLAPTSTVTLPSNGQPGPVRYNVTGTGPGGVAVFNVDAASVFNSSLVQQIDLNAAGASSIVINVAGTTVNFNTGNFAGSWTSPFARSKVIWNFFEATSIRLDRNFNGAILAPLAHLQNTTDIDGSVFVRQFTQGGEVHLPIFSGFVPAPGAGVLAMAGLALAARRRRA